MFLLLLHIVFGGIFNTSFEKELDGFINTKFAEYDSVYYKVSEDITRFSSIELVSDKKENLIGNVLYLPVQITDNSEAVKQKYLNVKVKLFKYVFTANRQINRNEAVSFENTNLILKEITSYNSTPAEGTDMEQPKRARINIPAGEIISIEFIEDEPIVYAGDRISASYVEGTVAIEFKATARQDGSVNELISIKGNNRQYKAKIVGPGNVIIIE